MHMLFTLRFTATTPHPGRKKLLATNSLTESSVGQVGATLNYMLVQNHSQDRLLWHQLCRLDQICQ